MTRQSSKVFRCTGCGWVSGKHLIHGMFQATVGPGGSYGLRPQAPQGGLSEMPPGGGGVEEAVGEVGKEGSATAHGRHALTGGGTPGPGRRGSCIWVLGLFMCAHVSWSQPLVRPFPQSAFPSCDLLRSPPPPPTTQQLKGECLASGLLPRVLLIGWCPGCAVGTSFDHHL